MLRMDDLVDCACHREDQLGLGQRIHACAGDDFTSRPDASTSLSASLQPVAQFLERIRPAANQDEPCHIVGQQFRADLSDGARRADDRAVAFWRGMSIHSAACLMASTATATV
jgi:hypothetical protein